MENSNLNSFQQEALYNELVNSATTENIFKLFSMLKPKLFINGDQWCVLYGEEKPDRVVGFGDTPQRAVCNWNQAWYKSLKDK